MDEKTHRVLVDLVATIDATGGLVRDKKGYLTLAADEDWIDLMLVYRDACERLGREPHITDRKA